MIIGHLIMRVEFIPLCKRPIRAGRVNTYTDPELLPTSSSKFVPINAVSPYKETEIPKLSSFFASVVV